MWNRSRLCLLPKLTSFLAKYNSFDMWVLHSLPGWFDRAGRERIDRQGHLSSTGTFLHSGRWTRERCCREVGANCPRLGLWQSKSFPSPWVQQSQIRSEKATVLAIWSKGASVSSKSETQSVQDTPLPSSPHAPKQERWTESLTKTHPRKRYGHKVVQMAEMSNRMPTPY